MLAWLNRLLRRDALFSAHGGGCRVHPEVSSHRRREWHFSTHHGSGNRPASKLSVERSADKRGFEQELPLHGIDDGRMILRERWPTLLSPPGADDSTPKRRGQHKDAKPAHGNSIG